MYAKLTIANAKPGEMDECIKLDREFVLPAEKKLKGFKGYYLLFNRKTNKGIGLSLWDTEADANAWVTSNAFRELAGKLMSHFTGPPTIEEYEVGIQEQR